MPRKFDPSKKKLSEAKPSICILLRDNGETEFLEGCKDGEELEIMTGKEKAYITLDQSKIRSFRSEEDEDIYEIDGKYYKLLEVEKIKTYRDYKQNVERIKLKKTKKHNFGSSSNSIMGYVAYEKEKVCLPTDVVHDSRIITRIMDYIRLAYKDFHTQKIEAWKSAIITGIVIVLIAGFVYAVFIHPRLMEDTGKTVVNVISNNVTLK